MPSPTTVYQLNKPTVSGDADAWGGQLNTDLDSLDTFLARPRWKKNAPTVTGTTTLDFSLANFFEFTVGQATTLSITNVPATLPDTTVPFIRAILKITNGGAFVITWPGSIVWPYETANAAPTGLAVSGVDVIELISFDAGTTWYAMLHHIKTDPNLWPRASVYKSGTQAASPGANIVSFDSERFDVGSMHDNVTNNSRITIPAGQGGLYHIVTSLQLATSSAGRIRILKNGALLREQEAQSSQEMSLSIYEVLVPTDFIQVEYNLSGISNTINSGISKTSFEMARVR
jgi:hypothetical protein